MLTIAECLLLAFALSGLALIVDNPGVFRELVILSLLVQVAAGLVLIWQGPDELFIPALACALAATSFNSLILSMEVVARLTRWLHPHKEPSAAYTLNVADEQPVRAVEPPAAKTPR